MSTSSNSDSGDSIFDIEELLVIEARCRELRKEKDLLKETQSQSFDLIKKLELHVRRLNEARSEDKRRIQNLEKELINSHQEIDYLRVQLSARNATVEGLEEEIFSLREDVKKSNSQCEFLMQELETRETELHNSILEYQCEIESMRLEMMGLEQKCFDPPNPIEGSSKLELQLHDAEKTIETLQNEIKSFCQKVEDHFKISTNEKSEDLGLLLPKLLAVAVGEHSECEELVKKLKEELRQEKLKAKDEAEELAQEMAELRYQMTELLEEERKRRAFIEQASLQRISELEAQLPMDQRRSGGHVRYICEA